MMREWALAAALILMGASNASALTIVGVSWDSSPYAPTVWSIDPTTGAGVPIGVSGQRGLNSLARRSDGALLSTATFWAPFPVVEINPHTGSATVGVAPDFGDAGSSVRALAFSPEDELFALVDHYPSHSDLLFSLDTVTGEGTLIADLGVGSIQALEFSPDGVLYGWDLTDELITINPTTGAVSDVSAVYQGRPNIQALAFAPDGTLYGAAHSLFTIDVSTGVASEVGDIGVVGSRGNESIRGIAVIPEPSTLVLLGVGIAHLASYRRPTRR